MLKQGEAFRARAYQKAQETIMAYPNDITSREQLKVIENALSDNAFFFIKLLYCSIVIIYYSSHFFTHNNMHMRKVNFRKK